MILPPFTFFATVGAICRAGARPVFADIDPATYNLDPVQVESHVTPRTRAIMVVHLFGQCADMDPLWRVAERHNLAIIDRAIAEARSALGADPSNGYLSGHLMETRRRKLDLLRRAAELTETN